MSKRIRPIKTDENRWLFVDGTDLICFKHGQYDAIDLIANGELVVGAIHRFYITEVQQKFTTGARLNFRDISPVFGEFKRSADAVDNLEVLQINAWALADLMTANGELITVQAELNVTGSTDSETGTTSVVLRPGQITGVVVDLTLDHNHPFLDVYRRQTDYNSIDVDNSGYVLEATAEVAVA